MTIISVIVPVYNCKESLHLTLDGLINQTYQNLEIILIDDGSQDGSGDLCDKYSQQDLRIRVIHQSNKGISAARNIGIQNSHGDYISFIDAGDMVNLAYMNV